MQVVFELSKSEPGRAYIVDVLKIDEGTLRGVYKGQERSFELDEIRNATTVTGRPFSLRPYDAARLASAQSQE